MSHASPLSVSPDDAVVATASRTPSIAILWKGWTLVVAVSGLLYFGLYNGYWVPGGDSELYVSIARSIAHGEGFKFNNQPVNICPPGWPLILAGLMKISPSFLFLKAFTATCLALTMGLWYWVMLRVTTPRNAALLAILTAGISHVFSLSFWMHAEAVFCLTSTAAILVAFRINENRPGQPGRIATLIVLLIAGVFLRFAGALQAVVVAAILVNGLPLPLLQSKLGTLRDIRWITAIAGFVVCAAIFFGLRSYMHLQQTQEQQMDAGLTTDDQTALIEGASPELLAKSNYHRTWREEMTDRAGNAARWFSWLLWQPFRFVAAIKSLRWLDALAGYGVIALLIISIARATIRRQWVWLGVGVYCFALVLGWPNPNARYFVPILPFIVLGTARGLMGWSWSSGRVGRLAVGVFFASIAIVNASLYAVEFSVQRSSRFYDRYEAGTYGSIIDISHYLAGLEIEGKQTAISSRYQNLGKTRLSFVAVRAAVMLTGRNIQSMPLKFTARMDGKLVRELRNRRVVYYVHQEAVNPWRVWHFRLPAWLQSKLTRAEVPPEETGGWALYQLVQTPVYRPESWDVRMQHVLIPVNVPRVEGWPRRVPGM